MCLGIQARSRDLQPDSGRGSVPQESWDHVVIASNAMPLFPAERSRKKKQGTEEKTTRRGGAIFISPEPSPLAATQAPALSPPRCKTMTPTRCENAKVTHAPSLANKKPSPFPLHNPALNYLLTWGVRRDDNNTTLNEKKARAAEVQEMFLPYHLLS